MEDPLRIIRNFAGALDRIAQTLADNNGALIVQEIAFTILARVDELDDIHEFFFRLHHPDRGRFEHEGWPHGAAEDAADADQGLAPARNEKPKTRLRQAREAAGYKSASDAARKNGWLTEQGNDAE